MDPKTAVGVPQFLQMTGVAVFIFAAYAIWPVIQRKWYLAKFPSMNEYGTGEKYRQTYLSSAREIYEKGYTKVTSSRTRTRTKLDTDNIPVQELLLRTHERTRYIGSLSKSTHLPTTHVFAGIPTVVIPASLLPELRKLPEDVLSRREAISQAS